MHCFAIAQRDLTDIHVNVDSTIICIQLVRNLATRMPFPKLSPHHNHLHQMPKPWACFQFDPEAVKDIDETHWSGGTLLKAQMNANLLTDELKKKRAGNESFWLIGQSDARVERITNGEDASKFRISVQGFDYYSTKTSNVDSSCADQNRSVDV